MNKIIKVISLKLFFFIFCLTVGFTLTGWIYSDNNTYYRVTLFEKKEIPKYIPLNSYGSFMIKIQNSQLYTKEEIVSKFHDIFRLSSNNKFFQINEEIDVLGLKHTTFQHYLGDYPVEGQMVIIHSKDDKVVYINGTIIDIENIKSTHSLNSNLNKGSIITKQKALDIVKRELNLNSIVEQKPVETVFYKTDESASFVLAQKVNVDESEKTIFKGYLYVDAYSGEILGRLSKIYNIDVIGKGKSFYRGVLPITIRKENRGFYSLSDEERKIYTLDASSAEYILSDSKLIISNSKTFEDSPAIDVHWGMGKVYDYYKEIHNRLSFDNKKTEIINLYNPASWDGISGFPYNASALPGYNVGIMLFGRGGDSYMNPVVSLDITSHEYSHLVIDNNGKGGLTYQGESGALNESFADIFGTATEFFSVDDPNWRIGEEVVSYGDYDYMRNMANPKQSNKPQPNTYKGEFWVNTVLNTSDYGGVHTNSGVLNYWFYLITEGGEGINDIGNDFTVYGMGIKKAEQIAFLTLMTSLTKNAQYIDVYEATIYITEMLFGKDEYEYNAVVDAWYAVGLGERRPNMGVQEFVENKKPFKVFPNPVIQGELNIIADFDQGRLELYSISGQKLNEFNLIGRGEQKMNLKHLQKGGYILKITERDKIYIEKILIR